MSDKKDENIFIDGMRGSPLKAITKVFRHGCVITSMRLFLYLIISCRFLAVCVQALRTLGFWVERFVFNNRKKLEDKHLVVRPIISILRSSSSPVFLSFLFIVIIYWFSLSVTLPESFRNIIESLLPDQVNGWLNIDSTIYVTLLTTIAGITGVFLALYFTTLSLVAISYSEPHHREIRNLIINNAVSRGYLFLVAHLGAITLFGLAFVAIGFLPNFFLMVYVLIIAAIVIFSFFMLGCHIFRFLDPRDLMSTPKSRFLKFVKLATVAGGRSNQPPFQWHFQKQALYELYRLECLTEFALSQSARSEIVRDLCITLLDILSRYVTDSSKIPNLSMWFPRKRVFQEWGFTSSIQADIAMRTGTTPQPVEKPDYLFVSNAISRMVRQSLQYSLKGQDYSETLAILIEIHRTMGQLGENLAIDEACRLLSEVRDVLFSGDFGLSVVETNDKTQAMSMASAYGTCILNLAISASQALESKTVDEILSSYADLKLHSTRQLYDRKHPREVLEYLEEFHKKLLFEQKTEGRLFSADWFLKEQVAQRYADYIWHLSEKLVQCLTDFCIQPVNKMMKADVLWLNAELLRSSIETTKKIKLRITALNKMHQKISENQINKEDWVNSDFVALEQKIQGFELELLNNIASFAHKLTSDINVGDAPDYTGIFRAYLGDALVLKMTKQDMNQFENLFAGIFKTTFEVASRHIGAKDEHFSKPHMKIAFDTILDLLDLSGLALLFSELQGSSFFEIIKKEWDVYFKTCPNAKFAIEFFYGSIDMVLQLPALSASGTRRFSWERTFICEMANAGFDVEGRMTQWEGEEKVRADHNSRIIQSIRPHMGMIFRRPYDYFAAFYLSERPEAEGIDLPNNALECKEAVVRENRRRAEGTDL